MRCVAFRLARGVTGAGRLRCYVEGHKNAIRLKAEIIVDHFREQVLARHGIGDKARAMVITNGIEWAIPYFHAIRDPERHSRIESSGPG